MGHPPRLLTAAFIGCCLLLLVQPSYTNRCTVGCHGLHSDHSYKEGQTYTYALEGRTVSLVSEGQGEAYLKLKANVELAIKPDCIRQLRLKNVQVNGAAVPQDDLEKYALQFNYHHGHVDTELCAEPGDSQASLNIKRAVISLFQSSVVEEEGSTSRHEIDVLGGCLTDFTFSKEADVQIVRKSRNLNHCSSRENIKQGLFSGIVNPSAGIQSTPLIGANQEVELRFKGGVLDKAVSTETYKLRPFSNGDAGAKTVVETTLTFKGKKEDSPLAPVSLPKSLIFEPPHPVIRSSVESIEKALQSIHKDDSDAVKPEEARKFSELIRVLRSSNKNDILTVYHRIKAGAGYDKERDKNALLDALYRTGTGEAAEVVVELIKNKEISNLQALLYYSNLAFIQHVNLASVTAIVTLLDQPSLSRVGYLGIGQIIGRYCQYHPCQNVPEIKSALEKIVAKVKDGKADSRSDENVIVAALKGLGNAKYLDDTTLQKIANIAADKEVRNRVRVAAIEALPTKCSMVWKNILFKTFADQEEDSEIRIKSYLSFVSCPCAKVANEIKEVLDKEKVYQVGSFITSHLRNLRASADPFKQDAKAHLGQIKPRTKFPEDFRKFSFNNELSYSLDAFGVGATAERNVIFSQNSFIPRSASLNLTTEIFGHSFNFLELNTRAENLDRLIEHFFGPKGTVTNVKSESAVKNGYASLTGLSKYISERFDKSIRGKRDVKQADIDKFANSVQLRGNEVDENLDFDLSVKLFGAELAFLSYEGSGQAYNPQQIVDKIFGWFDQGVNKIKNLNYDVEKHIHFLDAEFIYPTGLGVALNLGLTGSSVVRAKINNKIDIPAIIKVAVEPSASIELVGDLIVADGFGTESGVKLVTTLHTATGYDLNVKYLNGKGIDVSLGVPKRKQEIISISSEVFYSTGKPDKYAPIKFSKGKERSDCFDQFTAPLGFTVCGHISYPYDNIASLQKKPLYPLSGPFKFYVTIENNDVSSYHFKALYNNNNPKDRSFEVLLETPNSRTSRYVSLVLQAAVEPDLKLKFSFDSPINKASAEAVVKRNAREHSLTVTIKNDQIEYFARAGVESLGGSKYKPVLEYKVPEHIEKLAGLKGDKKASGKGGQIHQVEGTVEVADHDGGKKYVFNDVQLISNGRKVIGIDGNAVSTPKSVEIDVSLGYADEKLGLKVDGKRLGELQYTLSASALPSKNPANSFAIEWDYHRQKTRWDHKFAFVQGADLKSKDDRLQLTQSAEFNVEPDKFALSTKNKLTYPKVALVVKFDAALTKQALKTEAELKYDKFKFGAELSGKINANKKGDYDVEFSAEVLENKVKLLSKRLIVDETTSKFENLLKLTPGGTYQADATIKWQAKKNDVNIVIGADISLNSKKIKVDTGFEHIPEKLNNYVQIIGNGIKYVDYSLKVHKGQEPTGDLVLNLKNYLTTSGHFAYKSGTGNADLTINIPKINREIKGEGAVTISGSKYNAKFGVAYDAGKDPNKKIEINTVTDLTKNSISSNNVIKILTYKTEINLSGQREGDLFNGKQNGNIEIVLPNGRYLTWKIDRTALKKDDKIEAKGIFEVADYVSKGGEGKKLIVNFVANFASVKDRLFDNTYQIKYVHDNGKDLILDITGKNLAQPNSEKKAATANVKVSGSLIPYTAGVTAAADYERKNVVFKGSAYRGTDFVIESNVNYVIGNEIDKPTIYKGDIQAKLPSEALKNIKLEFDDSLLVGQNGNLEFTRSKILTYNDDKKIKIDSHYKHSGEYSFEALGTFMSTFSLSLKVLDKPTLTITDNYNHDLTGELKKIQDKGSIKFGDKEITSNFDLQWLPEFNKVSVNGKFTTPFEKLKDIDLHVDHKRENEKSRKTEIALTVDGVKYTQTTEIELEEAPGIHLVFTYPAGITELLAKFKKLGDNEYSGDYKLLTPKGFITVDGRIKLESVDDFVLNVNFDSDKFKHRKIHAEIANKLSSQDGRRIFITVTTEGKNLVTGSTNYKRHEEDKKVTLEGSGSLKVGENTKSSSFKYVRKQLTRESDKEVGVAIILNASFGPSAIVGELKLSDKEVHVFNSYCEQSKDCAHFKLQSTLDTDHLTHLNHNLQVEVNLKKFNVPVEFGLLSGTKYADYSLDHQANLYLHSSKDRTQYTYHVYFNKRESAAVLSLPSRELAIVAFHDVPAIKHSGAYKIDVSLYLDRKNKPAEKTSLIFAGDINVEKNAVAINGEAKFTYPAQTKDLIVKGKLHAGGEQQLLDVNVDIDVFNTRNDKITLNAKLLRQVDQPKGYNVTSALSLRSKGQHLDVKVNQHYAVKPYYVDLGSVLYYTDKNRKPKSLGAYFIANLEQVDLFVYLPDKELVKSHTAISVSKHSQKFETEFSLLGKAPVALNYELKDYNSFTFDLGRKDDAKNKIVANGKVVLGQLAEIHADAYKDGGKQDLFHLLIHLDEGKFMKPDFAYNNKNIIATVNKFRESIVERIKQFKQVSEGIGKEVVAELTDFVEHLKKAQPSFKPLITYFEGELIKLKNELHADQTIKEIQDILNKTFGGLIAAITETVKKFAEHFEELHQQLSDICNKLQQAIKSTYPQLKESFDKVFKVGVTIFDTACKLATAYVEAILKVLNEHQKDIEELVSVASELAQDIAKIVVKGANQIEKEVKEFVQLLVQQVRALPIYEVAQKMFNEIVNYKLPDYIIGPIEEFCNNIKNLLPTQELKDFFTSVYNYILKHVKHQKVDDSSEVKKIYSLAWNAVRSIINLLQSHATVENVFGFLETQFPVDISYLRKLPGLSTIRFSVLKLLLNRELPSISDIYYVYRPAHRVHDLVPPAKKYGFFGDGGYIITFDGRQFVFSGTCNYILAQDMQDGNFSVVGEYANGNLVSVTITEPGETATIKSNGNILINNKPADYPASTKNLEAYLATPLRRIKSKYGAKVVCKIGTGLYCYLKVSGYYHARLRGLLGDANNEPSDDYILPNGKITTSATDFGSAYKLNPSCGPATAKDGEAPRAPICSKYFSGDSKLSSCFNYVDPKPFRQVCDQLVASGQKSGGCIATNSYSVLCSTRDILISPPKDCVQCKVGDSFIDGGDSFSVRIPRKQADIIFVVEQDVDNEKVFKDLVKPLMGEIRTELKQQGITDVFIGLIGFGEGLKWPRYYTSNNNVNIEGGDINHMVFSNVRESLISFQEAKEDKTNSNRLKYLRQRLDVELGTFKVTDAYEAAIRYPFRAAAAKVVVGLISLPCEKSPLSPFSFQDYRLLLGRNVYNQLGLTYYHVSPLKDLEVSGKPQKNIVGFDKEYAYTFTDSKKKPLEGNAELKNNLALAGGDVCAVFAVNTGGAAFSTHNFLEAKPNQQAQYIKVVARRISENLASVEIDEDCVCGVEVAYGYAVELISRPHCKVVNRHEKSRHKPKA